MFIADTYGTGSDTQHLYCELEQLIALYGETLNSSNVRSDIELLKWMARKSMNGSVSATYFLKRHGSRILTLIKEHIFLHQQHNVYS